MRAIGVVVAALSICVAAGTAVAQTGYPEQTVRILVGFSPGELTYAHAGAGTSQHLAAELLKSMMRLDIRPVAYRGTTALLPDLLAGRVSMSFGNIVNVMPLVREGKLRAFAVTSINALPYVRRKLNDLGLDVIGGSPAELAAVIEREIPQWARVIRQAGIKAAE